MSRWRWGNGAMVQTGVQDSTCPHRSHRINTALCNRANEIRVRYTAAVSRHTVMRCRVGVDPLRPFRTDVSGVKDYLDSEARALVRALYFGSKQAALIRRS